MADDDDRGPVMYQDGDAVVLCDRSNPNAWVRSDTTVSLPDGASDRAATERP